MKLALIGCGAQGLAYAAAAAELGLEIAVCADPTLSAAKKAAALGRARAVTSCDSILNTKDIFALLLCAPAQALPSLLRLAARARKHALAVPPLATTPGAARKVLLAARGAGIHLYLAHDSRVAPEHAALAAQLDAGAIGKPGFIRIVRAGASPAPKANTGALALHFPADLDWLVPRFGAAPRVFAQTSRVSGVDHASLHLQFPGGPIVQWIGTCRPRGGSPRNSIEICGEAGMIQFTSDDLILESSAIAKEAVESVQRSSPLTPSLATRHLARFAALIRSDPSGQSYDHDGTVIGLLETVLQSARSRQPIAS